MRRFLLGTTLTAAAIMLASAAMAQSNRYPGRQLAVSRSQGHGYGTVSNIDGRVFAGMSVRSLTDLQRAARVAPGAKMTMYARVPIARRSDGTVRYKTLKMQQQPRFPMLARGVPAPRRPNLSPSYAVSLGRFANPQLLKDVGVNYFAEFKGKGTPKTRLWMQMPGQDTPLR